MPTKKIVADRTFYLPGVNYSCDLLTEEVLLNLGMIRPPSDAAKLDRSVRILVVDAGFGEGSEHVRAVTLLKEFGIGAVVGPSCTLGFHERAMSNELPFVMIDDCHCEVVRAARLRVVHIDPEQGRLLVGERSAAGIDIPCRVFAV